MADSTKFWKDLIAPGVFAVPSVDPAGGLSSRFVSVTPGRINRWIDKFKEMRAAGLEIPVPWSHPDQLSADGKPTKTELKQHRAKFNAGWMEDIRLKPDGTAEALIDIPLEEDRKRIAEVGTFMSPEFGGTWHDGEGREWVDVITHASLTPKPVNKNQSKSVRRADVSIAMANDDEPLLGGEVLRFSLDDLVQFDNEVESSKEESDDKSRELESKAKVEEDKPSMALPRLIDGLKKIGVIVPESIKLSGDLDTLLSAVMTCAESCEREKGGAKEPDEDDDPKGTKDYEEGTGMVNMDLNDPVVKSLHDEVSQARRDKLNSRIEALVKSGRCTPAIVDKFFKEPVGRVQFALDGKPSVEQSAIEAQLALLEALPANSTLSTEELVTQISEEERGQFFEKPEAEPLSEEETNKIVDKLLRKGAMSYVGEPKLVTGA